MIKTINNLNELGKCFYIEPSEENGFYNGGLCKVTTMHQGTDRVIQLFIIDVGEDYKGPELPKGTERILLRDFNHERQVIEYQKASLIKGRIPGYKTFCNEFRSKDARKEIVDFGFNREFNF